MSEPLVWVVDDDASIRWVLNKILQKINFQVELFIAAEPVLQKIQEITPDLIISDIKMGSTSGLDLLQEVRATEPNLPVIIMTAYSDMDSTISAYEGGAFEYLPKPFDIEEVSSLALRAVENSKNSDKPQQQKSKQFIIGKSLAMQEVFRSIGRLSNSSMTVLINGESGTGKERVAQVLHQHSPRADRPFIALNMAAIPKDLMDSELFGHEKGSFTGATAVRKGRFQQADGGTLFLDEIGDMPLETQTRLLRVLSEGEFYQVGGVSSTKVDVRIIAATHQELRQAVKDGRFREDLYHRLNVIKIHLPKLQERREDIPLLAEYFLEQVAAELSVEKRTLLPKTIKYLMQLEWDGNVRELENLCRWLTVMSPDSKISVADLPPELQEGKLVEQGDLDKVIKSWLVNYINEGGERLASKLIPKVEKILIETALEHTAGKKHKAAQLIGWGRNTLAKKLSKHQVNHPVRLRLPPLLNKEGS